MVDPILVGTDGQPDTEIAVAYAMALAGFLDRPLEVLYVGDERLIEAVEYVETEADLVEHLETAGEAIVEDVADRASELDVETSVVTGVPHRELLSRGAEASLIVLGRAHADASSTGSVGTRVIARTTTPVLTVPAAAADPPAGGWSSAVVPTDGSDFPDRALTTVGTWLDPGAGRVHGLYVIDASIYDLSDAPRSVIGILREGGEGALADLEAVAGDLGVVYGGHTRRGDVVEEILDLVDDVDPDVVAMGSRGRSAGDGPILGSTTEALLREAGVPVLTAP